MATEESITVRALRTEQARGVDVYTFFIRGSDIQRVADISRLRFETEGLKGFQRREIRSHISAIVEFLKQRDVIFPNALILALGPDVEFRYSRGPRPRGAQSLSAAGTLTLPVRPEGDRVAWIVDGQQRSLALSEADDVELVVPVVGFVSTNIDVQREQFILVNKVRPLPNRLIDELLPEIGTWLPRDLSSRRLPSALCKQLNTDPKSPFYGHIRQLSGNDEQGVVIDTAVSTMIRHRLKSPLGALAPYRALHNGASDVDGMYRALCSFWWGVREVFDDAWGLPPQRSRLMHSAGILAMGVLMDRVMARVDGHPDARVAVRDALNRLAPHCHWTDGEWEGLGLDWNEIQNTPRDIRVLAEHLVRLDYACLQERR
jgi:DGQHR domain-containing protein